MNETSKPQSNPNLEWWKSFHVIEMADLFLERSSQAELEETSDFLRQELGLSSNSHAYDQCCGTGTLSFELARHGVRATSVDLCGLYIQRAQEQARSGDVSHCEFQCADAFNFVTDSPCDGVFNWYSSFGYAHKNSRNQMMLARAFESLKPGGGYALDVPNFPGLIRGFQRHLVRTGTSGGRQVTCVRESSVNLRAGLLEQTWNWIVEGRPIDQRKSALRIYFPHEIVELLEAVGFVDVELYGQVDKRKLELDSPRLIVVARRPE